jgi:hypothetical protein
MRASNVSALPQRDKVVPLLDKIRNVRHGNPLDVSAALGTYLNGITLRPGRPRAENIGEFMRRGVVQLKNAVLRFLAVPGLALLIGIGSAAAQSGEPHSQDQSGKPAAGTDATKDNQRKTDEFVEAAQAINGPAGNPECVWLGRRAVILMSHDDLDTAFRHLDLYDRFGCPGGHIQATFRCLARFGLVGVNDPKASADVNARVHACWINPGAQPQAAAATTPAPPPSTAGTAPATAAAPAAPAASPAPAPAK